MNDCDEGKSKLGCKNQPTHYYKTDDLGYYHYVCDEHDPRPLFQENRRLKKAMGIAIETLEAYKFRIDPHVMISEERSKWEQEFGLGAKAKEALEKIKEIIGEPGL